MAQPVSGAVGEIPLQDGACAVFRQGRLAEQIVSLCHAELYETTSRSHAFLASVSLGTLTTAAVSCTGLIIINPTGNTKNAAIGKVYVSNSVTSSATEIWLAQFVQAKLPSTMTTATAVTMTCGKLGSATATVGAYSSCNALDNAPALLWPLLHNTVAIATTGEDQGALLDLQGGLIVPPGYGIAIVAPAAATGAGINAGIWWEEVAV